MCFEALHQKVLPGIFRPSNNPAGEAAPIVVVEGPGGFEKCLALVPGFGLNSGEGEGDVPARAPGIVLSLPDADGAAEVGDGVFEVAGVEQAKAEVQGAGSGGFAAQADVALQGADKKPGGLARASQVPVAGAELAPGFREQAPAARLVEDFEGVFGDAGGPSGIPAPADGPRQEQHREAFSARGLVGGDGLGEAAFGPGVGAQAEQEDALVREASGLKFVVVAFGPLLRFEEQAEGFLVAAQGAKDPGTLVRAAGPEQGGVEFPGKAVGLGGQGFGPGQIPKGPGDGASEAKAVDLRGRVLLRWQGVRDGVAVRIVGGEQGGGALGIEGSEARFGGPAQDR